MTKYFEQGVIDAFNNKKGILHDKGFDYLDGVAFGEHLLDQININKFCSCDFDYSNLHMRTLEKKVNWKEI